MNPFFSIIIPVYNVAPYLRECLDSVLAQTFADWEALCVDDGSTDGSGAILNEYAVRDRRFRVIHQPNGGVSAARNAALDVARGEWVCFLDADDKIESHWLEDIALGAKDHPEADWIRTSYRDWIEGREPVPWPKGHPCNTSEKIYPDAADIAWHFLAYNGMMTINVFRRTTIQSIRFQTGLSCCEDGCFVLDIAILPQTRAILTIPNDDYRYRMRDTSASHSITCSDITKALMAEMDRWVIHPSRRGVFSPAIDRYILRCLKGKNTVTKQEAKKLCFFARKATRCGFFSPFYFKGKKMIRWLLFLLFGNPLILFEKASWNWLVPYGNGVAP